MRTILLVIAGLLLLGCASQNTPYDVPVVGEKGVAQITGVERWDYKGENVKEVLVFHAVMDDGRACDFAWMKKGNEPDRWLALHRQRPSTLGVVAPLFHVELPEDICLTVTRRSAP